MKKMNTKEMKEIYAGKGLADWDKCRICGNYVSGGFLKKYAHCVKHSAKFVFSVVDLYRKCFG